MYTNLYSMILKHQNWQKWYWSYHIHKTLSQPHWQMYLLHAMQRHKQPVKIDFYIAKEEGSVLLSPETVFQLQLLNVKPWLEYLPQRAMFISSAVDYPKKKIHTQSTSPQQPNSASILPTSKSKIPQEDTPKKIRIVKNKAANSGTVPRTLWRHRLIPRWAISYSYI